MRRVMLLALFALALPTAALASNLEFDSGTFQSGTITGNFSSPFNIMVVGSESTISLTGATITPPCSASIFTCAFGGGILTVMEAGSTVFTDHLSGGTIFNLPGNITSVVGNLLPNADVAMGTVLFNNTIRSGNNLTGGTAVVSVITTIPEPGTLGLLGTGLMGLAGMARRKLKLPI